MLDGGYAGSNARPDGTSNDCDPTGGGTGWLGIRRFDFTDAEDRPGTPIRTRTPQRGQATCRPAIELSALALAWHRGQVKRRSDTAILFVKKKSRW